MYNIQVSKKQLKLVKTFKGRISRMKFKELTSRLSQELGCTPAKAQEALVTCAGGEFVYVPKDYTNRLIERNQRILTEQGNAREIADKYYLSERQVRNIFKKGKL